MRGQSQSTSLQGRAVSVLGSAVLTACLVGMPLTAFAQTSPDTEREFSAEADAMVDTAFDLAAEDDVPGAIRVLGELSATPGLSAYEQSTVSQMMGAFHYDAGNLYEAKIAFDAAVAAGGLSDEEISKMKPTLVNINALDKLGLLKPKVAPAREAEPKALELKPSGPKLMVESIPESSKKIIVKTEPVPDNAAPALLMASTESAESIASIITGQAPDLGTPEIETSVDETPEVETPDADLPEMKAAVSDQNAQPTKRPPPVFPSPFLRGNNSGYCKVRFDVNPEGTPVNIQATTCTSVFLERPTIKSVETWTYDPKIVNGGAVMRNGVESIIQFDLQDEDGEVLPLPNGY